MPDAAYAEAGFGAELEEMARLARARVETAVRLIKLAEATYEDAAQLARAVQMVAATGPAPASTTASLAELGAQAEHNTAAERAASTERSRRQTKPRRWAPMTYIEAARLGFLLRRLRPVSIPGTDQAGDIFTVQALALVALTLAFTEIGYAPQSWRIALINAGLLDVLACLTVCRTLTTPDAMVRMYRAESADDEAQLSTSRPLDRAFADSAAGPQPLRRRLRAARRRPAYGARNAR